MKNQILVFGHRNPDTDTIVSSIAYAELKNKQGYNAVACRLGSLNNETEFLLEKFGFEEPKRITSARSLLSEIELDKIPLVSKDLTMKEALEKTLKTKTKVLLVGDKKKHLEGLISLDDLTYMWTKTDKELEFIIKQIKLENITKLLNAKVITTGNKELSGKMHMFPSVKSNVEEGSIVVSRNENEKIDYCLDKGVALIVVVTSSPIAKNILNKAKEKDVTIIVTALSPLSVTRLIYQCPTIEWVMSKKDKIIYFDDDETVQDATKKILKSRHRSYPVLDDSGVVIGCLSRFHLFNYKKKQLILVDHNETKQSIDNIDDGDVIEIIDHHRFGGFESAGPINVITKPYGSTSTIITELFINNKIAINKKLAGLLLGAIISDTMNFNSPTTTTEDRELAKKLEKISGIKSKDLSKEMNEHFESLLSKRLIDIVYDDFKEFNIDGTKVGLAQISCKSKKEFIEIKDNIQNYLEDACVTGGYELMIIMFTNINGTGSYLLSAGKKKDIINNMFNMKDNFVKGLLSRKKQLLPQVIKTLGEK